MSLRSELNKINLNRLDLLLGIGSLGELLTRLIASATPTEAGVVPSADIATLAAIPSAVFQVNATAGGVTGIKTLRKGLTSEVPASGECIWQEGTTKIKFSPADAVTATSVTYCTAAVKASIMEGSPEGL